MDYFRSKRFLDTLPDWESGRPAPGPLEDYLPRMRALLQCLEAPQERFPTIIVGGTNGKGTVSSLLGALLAAAGLRTGLYTSPHLHTQRERIQVNGVPVSKEQFAAAVSELYDRTRRFEEAGLGMFTRFEALTALALLVFARREVDRAVFEVGLGGRYDATNAWDSELAVLTSVDVDHAEVLGADPVEIAAEKLHITRPGRPLFTTGAQRPEVMERIRRECAARAVPLHVAGAPGAADGDLLSRVLRPAAEPEPGAADDGSSGDHLLPHEDDLAARPSTFLENARLALAVAGFLQPALSPDRAAAVVRRHHWPGRFEQAREHPRVILDGGHNPAGARRLVRDLQRLAPRWILVVGVGRGHDARGILAALRPAARQMLLTHSHHPKALPPEVLAAAAGEALPVERVADCRQAFARAVEAAGPEGHVCVTGSLYLVARAREFFDLPREQDGITEDVALESLACLRRACARVGAAYEPLSGDGNVVRVRRGGRSLHFLRNKNPFNDYVAARLAEDKGYQYELFSGAGVPVPRTLPVFNPLADARFDRYKTHASVEAVVQDAGNRFTYPLVVKKYRSSLAQGVFLESSARALARRLEDLFENSGFLDNLVLLQEFVPGPEYRIVASRDELLLAYGKVSEGEAGAQDLNPLHQTGGRAVRVEDPSLLARLERITAGVAAVIELGFYAIDVIDGPDGLRVLEINPNPFCYFYNRSHGRRDFVDIYAQLLERFLPG